MKRGISVVLSSGLLFFAFACTWSCCCVRTGSEGDEGAELNRSQVVQTAEKALKTLAEELSLDIANYSPWYDYGNEVWNTYYADRHPDIKDRDYQAVRFASKKMRQGPGPVWVCIDRRTGEVVQCDIGM